MSSGAGDTTQLVPGYPIRTPWDHSSVDSSPRPIAASHVLHRLLVPRHPPSALSNLTTKMLASTVQFSTNNHPHHQRLRLGQNHPVSKPNAGDHPEQPAPHGSRACSFRTQQGVHARIQPHRTIRSTPHHSRDVLGPPAVAGSDLPVSPPMSTPPPHKRAVRAPYPLSREGAP